MNVCDTGYSPTHTFVKNKVVRNTTKEGPI